MTASSRVNAADGTRISLGQLRISIGKAVLESRSSAGPSAPKLTNQSKSVNKRSNQPTQNQCSSPSR
ncbi:hypothetical protein J6590_063613 [Homalodisca vitripennis]|nr:hypothetical protein J6590_063613 [Homalodisca vitripennis]